MDKIRAFAANRIEKLRNSLLSLERRISPRDIDRTYEKFCTNFPLLAEKISRDFFFRSFSDHPKDYYVSNTFARWVCDSATGLYDIERAIRREAHTTKKLFYPDQFKNFCDDGKPEGQETALNEMVVGSRLSETGLTIIFRDRSEAGSDLIWKNEAEKREVHLEIITPQYSGDERKRLNQEIPKLRRERESALKGGQRVAVSTHVVSPFGSIEIADQVERIKKLKSSKNQVAAGDAGVQIVVWTLGLENSYFEPIFFDRSYLMSGFIYHAYYGRRSDQLYKRGSVVDHLREGQPPSYFCESSRSDGRFIKKDSKFAAAIFVDPMNHKGVFLRNYNSPKPLTRTEIISLVEALDAGRPPSRWLDMQEPNVSLGTKIVGR